MAEVNSKVMECQTCCAKHWHVSLDTGWKCVACLERRIKKEMAQSHTYREPQATELANTVHDYLMHGLQGHWLEDRVKSSTSPIEQKVLMVVSALRTELGRLGPVQHINMPHGVVAMRRVLPASEG